MAEKAIATPFQRMGDLGYSSGGGSLGAKPGDDGFQMFLGQLFFRIRRHAPGTVARKEPDNIATQTNHRSAYHAALAIKAVAGRAAVTNISDATVFARRIVLGLPRGEHFALLPNQCGIWPLRVPR